MKKIALEEHFASRASPRHHDQMRKHVQVQRKSPSLAPEACR